jgi:ankyrin repeat protein
VISYDGLLLSPTSTADFLLLSRSDKDIEDVLASWVSSDPVWHIYGQQRKPLEHTKVPRSSRSLHMPLVTCCRMQRLLAMVMKPLSRGFVSHSPTITLCGIGGESIVLTSFLIPPCPPPTLALYYVSLHGLHRSVKYLLEDGADANSVLSGYGNAIQAACRSGSIETVRVLIDHGAQLNHEDGGLDALQVVATFGNVDTVRVLLENGADVNALDETDRTALWQASHIGHVGVVRMLLEHNADVNLTGTQGALLEGAFVSGPSIAFPTGLGPNRARIVQLLLDGGADFNESALWLAYAYGHDTIVQMLLDRGAGINAEHGYRGAAICAAAIYGHRETLRLLLDRGADVEKQSEYFGTLQSVVTTDRGSIDRAMVRLLLEHGADPNVQWFEYGNALYAASQSGDLEVVRMLLQAGADVNATIGGYECASCVAAANGHIEVLQALLDHGANSNTQGGPHRDALEVATSKDHANVVEMSPEEDHRWQPVSARASRDPRLDIGYICND